MSLTATIAKNTGIQIVGKILSTLLGLVALGMMTRYLGDEQFGWYITVISFLGFAGILIDFGLIPVTAQMMSEPKFDKHMLLKNLLGFRFVTAFLFFGITPLVALFFPYPHEVKLAISFVSVSFLAISMNQVLVGFYQTTLKMYIQAIGEIIGRIVLIVGLWLVMAQGYGFLPVMVVITLSSIAYTAYLWISAYKYSPAGFAYDKEIWKAIVIKMWPIAISIIFNVIYLKGDILLLSWFRSQEEVGLYGAAYRVIDILAQMAMMIMGMMLPLLAYAWSRHDIGTFRTRYQQAFDMMMMLAIPSTVGIWLTADHIMRLVGGTEFIAAGAPLQLLAIAVFGVYLGAVFGHAAVAIDKQKQTMWIYISDAILTLIGYLYFIPKFGFWGAAGMTIFSELYAGILLYVTVQHYTKTPLRLQTCCKILCATTVMGLFVYFFLPFLHIFWIIPLAALVYGGVLVAIGGVSYTRIREILHLNKTPAPLSSLPKHDI
jgi:O-antigen/teichoic acid export membrane protein